MALLVSVLEAAKELGLSRSLLYQLARQGKIPCIRVGDRVMLNLDKVMIALEDGTAADRPVGLKAVGARKASVRPTSKSA
jgi:excisionase family DNA binding protein